MTPERLAEIRAETASGLDRLAPVAGSLTIAELLAELDAVTNERDQAIAALTAVEPDADVNDLVNVILGAGHNIDHIANRIERFHDDPNMRVVDEAKQIRRFRLRLDHAAGALRPVVEDAHLAAGLIGEGRCPECFALLSTALECPTHGPVGGSCHRSTITNTWANT